MPKEWFQNWFNSPFYHILYKQRDTEEAELFIDNLCTYLKPGEHTKMLDIACGKGRHSIYLNKKGYDVTGIDLSYNSIKYAKQFENDQLHFFVHDMRKLLYINYFDFSFNLFTSFGYFKTEKEHVSALKAFAKGLKKEGKLVLDYMNSQKIINNLVEKETKNIDGIDFHITRSVQNGKIVKTIDFYKDGKNYSYKEEVNDFKLDDFEKLFSLSGLKIEKLFGDYHLNEFDINSSDRLIFVCTKI
ncbi:Methyltransferase type 11 [Pseudopedobacter saltans DSM 12145]|uniref:Methyltransferase type 11 n=1 Tax=Pseudopedobacter saltans (strain ATCC 51119 / DSM 12145 / JCM 21818 / CCUG 39354 / LMG 10337 / NBRC 100064 / NCIMB 13643) TaxID=762903 RepID=F0SAK7_PSESL|nr:class I SAM-dependent methyltransferase [Pseudopedobacter saltans]ADY52627.1 Methyltransferase type 11 [Pseudopedobacter saltans DSM 12145]